jgi:hypothetical protein
MNLEVIKLEFRVIKNKNYCADIDTTYLVEDSRDDWFIYKTQYIVIYVD